MQPTLQTSTSWTALTTHHKALHSFHMNDAFREDPQRFQRFSLQHNGLLFDFSKNRITEETIRLLCQLAHTQDLSGRIDALFTGALVNTSEKRPALHTALRDRSSTPITVHGKNIKQDIQATLEKMHQFSEKVRNHQWRGCTGKPIRDIVNIGIGGSYLGPCFTTQALADFADPKLQCHFISNVDSIHIRHVLSKVDPETTLFIISSKSFTTLETLTNAKTVFDWFCDRFGKENSASHFIAVTAAKERAIEWGIEEENIFTLWNWVGGRYSIWSAIGLPLALLIGMENFYAFLEGGYQMDCHFRYTEFTKNMPALLGLLGIWYINFFEAPHHVVVPYSEYLHDFPRYIQQLDMESNGKNRAHNGTPLSFTTGPIIFGDQGCLGQHAFYQLLHQGQHLIPVDFLLVGQQANARLSESLHHDILMSSALSQAQALMRGKSYEEAYRELANQPYSVEEKAILAEHRVLPGNRPSNIIMLDKISPRHLGALIALYEHKIFVQGALWGINSFDQWGVELGKQLLYPILNEIHCNTSSAAQDGSTAHLIQHYKQLKSLAEV